MPLGGSPSRAQRSRPRSLSAGDDIFDHIARGPNRGGWIPPRSKTSEQDTATIVAVWNETLNNLKTSGRQGKGKGREWPDERVEEELIRLGDLRKTMDGSRLSVDTEQIIDW